MRERERGGLRREEGRALADGAAAKRRREGDSDGDSDNDSDNDPPPPLPGAPVRRLG